LKTLLIVSRAHAETAFRLAAEMHLDGDEIAILFMGRGTHYTSQGETITRLRYAKLYTLMDEFDSPLEEIQAINYEQFIELLENCERTFSWI
jgi:sulfur transfer complex TusBCD TusB component (DsrH family)